MEIAIFSQYKKSRGWSQDGILGGCGIHVSEQPGHLPGTSGAPWTPKGTEETHSNWVGWGLWGGVKGEEKWRQDGTGGQRGGWGGGEEIPRPKREIGGPSGGQRIKRESGQLSPAHLGSREPAEIPGLIFCPPRPPPATRVLREWEGGKGEEK